MANGGCFLCSKDHFLRLCPTFLNMNAEERLAAVNSLNLCTNCLSHRHSLNNCKSNFSCSKCKQRHHSLLHNETSDSSPSDNPSEEASTSQAAARNDTVQNYFIAANKEVILGTAFVNIICRGDVFKVRALIDPASQSTIISEKLQRVLNLPVRSVNAEISGVNGPGPSKKECLFILGSPLDRHFKLQVEGLVLPELAIKLPNHTVDVAPSALSGIELADPNFSKSSPVDIIIGGEIYPKIMRIGAKLEVLGELMAQETVFGWILTGPLSDGAQKVSEECSSFFTEVSIDRQMEKFWDLEEPPKVAKFTAEDEYCEELYKRTTKRNSDGRYIVSLPFKPQYLTDSGLGVSRERALRQFSRNETSLTRNPVLKEVYDNVLKEYEVLGHMSEAGYVESECSRSFYLPHHAVFKPESSSTKVRVVFNASSRSSSGLSLNDILYTGPVLQNDLMLLIIRWRFYRYVFNGDIEKMYRQILLDPGQIKFQRILFRGHPNDDLKDYELRTVTFGVNCAPFLAIRTLIQLADDVEEKWPLASKILRHMMYVDDALAGAHDVSLAIKARDQLRLALSSAGFSMKKWTSNDERILQGLPLDHLLSENFLEIDEESTAKTLGIRWNAKLDQFYFTTSPIPLKDCFTKREVLSVIAKLFDPAGWLGPIVIIAKMLMQQIWTEKTEWDQVLSENSGLRWRQFLEDYAFINEIKLPRWVG